MEHVIERVKNLHAMGFSHAIFNMPNCYAIIPMAAAL